MKKTATALAAFVLLCLSSVAWAQSQTNDTTVEYTIGAGDVIEISVFQDPTLNTSGAVGRDGRITMPLLGAVQVSGMTPDAAATRIKGLLEARYINKADVSVVIKEFESKPISVFGSVARPGKVPLSGSMTLIQAISAAGGVTPGSGKNIYVLRTSTNGLTSQLVIDSDRLLLEGDPDVNIPLQPNDVINVMTDKQISVYLLGEVAHPGVVQFRESQDPTLLQALAAAGGLTDRASTGDITVKRSANGKSEMMTLNLKKILKGQKDDFPLQDNDTIVIKESFF